jgi:hypothetical protein
MKQCKHCAWFYTKPTEAGGELSLCGHSPPTVHIRPDGSLASLHPLVAFTQPACSRFAAIKRDEAA